MYKFRFTILSVLVALVWVFLPLKTSALVISKTPANSLQTGLVGWWTFDGKDWASSLITKDKSVFNNNGTLIGGVAKVNGKIGQAINFTGTGTDYMSLGATTPSSLQNLPLGDFTACAWVYPKSQGKNNLGTIFDNYITPNGGWALLLVPNYALQLSIDYQGGTGNVYAHSLDNAITPRVWQHLCMVFNISTKRGRLFKNGIQLSLNGDVAGGTSYANDATHEFRIGNQSNTTDRTFDGKMDDVRIYSRALSTTEIQELYKQGGGVINKTDLIKAQLRTGLVGQLTFDGKDFSDATHAIDKSGRGNTGTLNGTLRKVNGKIGQALSFPGLATANITMADSAILNPGSGDYTVSTWFKYYGIVDTAHPAFIYNDYGSNTNNLVNLSIEYPSNQLRATYRDGSGNDILVLGVGPTVNDSKWHHVVWTKNNKTGYLYLDGVFITSDTDSLVGTITTNDANPPMVGRYSQDANNIGMFWGLMDDFRIYSRALSASEVQELYKQGGGKINKTDLVKAQLRTGLVGHWTFDGKDWASNILTLDKSGSNNNGILNGGVTKVNGKIGQAVKFDGSTGYINGGATGIIANNNYTYATWVKFKTLPADGTYYTVIGVTEGDQNFLMANNYNVTWHYTGFGCGSYYNASFGDQAGYNGVLPSINKWYHVACVRNTATNKISLYINGVLSSSTTLSSPTAYYGATQAVYIGRRIAGPGYEGYFNGWFDDARIYNRALSATEVYELYRMGK